MTLSKYQNDMHRLASPYADRPDIVQGAGGNVSVKMDVDRMLIKVSGREFSEIGSSGEGMVSVFYKKLAEYLSRQESQTATERDHLDMVRSCTDQDAGNGRPSMEVWFHTLLPQYVLHTHSVYVNILACSHEGTDLFREIMEKSGISYDVIPYCNPGFELGKVISDHLHALQEVPRVVFLENHGIIVSGDSMEGCVDIHSMVEEKIKESLGITDVVFDMTDLTRRELENLRSLVLFPDQVIYPEHLAVQAAHRFILKYIQSSGLRPRNISDKNADMVVNMDSERHRKNLRTLH